MDSIINKKDAVVSLIKYHEVKYQTDKNEIVTSIYYEAVVDTTEINFFHQHIMFFL